MNLFHIIIVGIVEGITEFLPISSTAHILIVEKIMGVGINSLEIIIQSGAILAVVALYIKEWKRIKKLFPQLIVALIPSVVFGALLYPIIKGYFFENMPIIAWAFILGGVILILVERKKKDLSYLKVKKIETINFKDSIIIGLSQCLAFIPGVSRSGATIVTGRLLNYDKVSAVEFSFFLSVPTILLASAYDAYKNFPAIIAIGPTQIIVGILVSFIAAYIAIKYLLAYLKTHSFEVFGWYRIVVGILILLFLI